MTKTSTIDASTRTLRMERVFKASRERIFEAFTNPALAQQWWGPEGIDTPIVEMDAREGGHWRTVMRDADGVTYTLSGTYIELIHPSRLSYTWGWVENGARGHETLVEIDLEEVPGGTKLKLQQAVFESVDACDDHNAGWTSGLDCLERIL